MVRTLILALCLAFSATTTFAQQIGVVASIDPRLTGTPPGARTRLLNQGTGVVLNERIVSSPNGRGQLLLRDQTTLSISPSSEIVLDAFVYNPGQDENRIGLNLARGALRFIGGRTTAGQPATIRTPEGTIGIRGSSALVRHVNGRTIAVFLMGDQMCFTSSSGRTCTSRRGGVLGADGYQGQIAPGSLADLLEEIDGTPPERLTRRGSTGTRLTAVVKPRSAPVSTRGHRREDDPAQGTIDSRSVLNSDPFLTGEQEQIDEFAQSILEDLQEHPGSGGLSEEELDEEFENELCKAFPGGGATGGVFPGRGRGGRRFCD